MSYIELQRQERKKEKSEAKRLLSIMSKEVAIVFCEEMAKKLPSINDTPPISRKSSENYMQFYRFGVITQLNKL